MLNTWGLPKSNWNDVEQGRVVGVLNIGLFFTNAHANFHNKIMLRSACVNLTVSIATRSIFSMAEKIHLFVN